MRTTLLLIAALLAAPVGPARGQHLCPPADMPALALPRTRAALAAGRPLTIVALGSSSTEGAGASAPAAAYPAQLEARLHAALPATTVRVVNRGRGGQEVEEMLARLDADVLAEHAPLVIWQTGTNAVLRGMDVTLFEERLALGIERILATGADVVLMDSQRAPRVLSAPTYERFDTALRKIALQEGVALFSRAALMRDWDAAGVRFDAMLNADGLHHNDRGYACLAQSLAGAILAGLGGGGGTIAGR